MEHLFYPHCSSYMPSFFVSVLSSVRNRHGSCSVLHQWEISGTYLLWPHVLTRASGRRVVVKGQWISGFYPDAGCMGKEGWIHSGTNER